jgi:hypothetical protein
MKKCIFCPQDAADHGGEHVWDDWINRAVPKARYNAQRFTSPDSPPITFTAEKLNEKFPVVCTTCNNGWMSALSLKVKDRFERAMLKGEPFSLGARDAAILAAFTFMKAVVTNHMIDHEPFFTRAARERLRTTLRIPPATKAWMAFYQGRARMSTRNSFSIVSTNDPGPLYGLEFCSFTHVVGNLALQLFAPRWRDISNRGIPVRSLNPNPCWQPATTLFWPHNGNPLSWPPAKYLSDDTIQIFVERFTRPVKVSNL